MRKICNKCNVEKDIETFRFIENECRYDNKCKDCIKIYNEIYKKQNKAKIDLHNKLYYDTNLENIKEKDKKRYEDNIELFRQRSKQYRIDNPEKFKESQQLWRSANKEHKKEKDSERYKNNKEKIQKQKNKYVSERKKSDPAFKLRGLVSNAVRNALKTNNSYKIGSIISFLPYTILELKYYLESLFEPWMTWENHGKYNKKHWDENDSATWTWSLDHIIPQSDILYFSMEDENFKKCWALSNLRPLSSKQNWLDGASRIRHNKGNL